jgi:hypothetical protein
MNLVECTICLETIDLNYKNYYITNCRHCFHDKCLSNWYNNLNSKFDLSNNFFCPNCRQPISDYSFNHTNDINFFTNIFFYYNSYISDLSTDNINVYGSNINYSNIDNNSNIDNIIIYNSNDYDNQYDNSNFSYFLNNILTSFTCSYSRSNI